MCVTSKIVSKAEGRVVAGSRAEAVAQETRRLVARRGPLEIVVNRLGLTMAAAGVDASNVEPGHVVLLPESTPTPRPGSSAPRCSNEQASTSASSSPTPPAAPGARARPTSPSAPPASRSSTTTRGATDGYGNALVVTAPAVADEIAGAAELAAGKLGRRPFTVVRGRGRPRAHAGRRRPGSRGSPPPGRCGPVRPRLPRGGARRPVRPAGRPGHLRGARGRPKTLGAIVERLTGGTVGFRSGEVTVTVTDKRAQWVAEVASYAHGWEVADRDDTVTRLRPVTP